MSRNSANLRVGPLKITGLSTTVAAVGVFLLVPLFVFLYVGPIMLMFGVVHSFYDPLPAFSFFETIAITLLIQLLTYRGKSTGD